MLLANEAHAVKTGDGSMKKNQPNPEPEMDGAERTRLAALGVLVGLLIVAGLVLVVTLSTNPVSRTPASSEVKQDAGTPVEVRDDPASAA